MPEAKDVLTLVWEWRSQRPDSVLTALLRVLRAHAVTESGYRYRGRSIDILDAIAAVGKARVPAFELHSEERLLHFASLADKFDQVIIESPRPDVVDCDDWVASLLGSGRFVMGWVADQQYDYWQNAEEPRLYARAGRDHAHLPRRSNGLPPPLEAEVIDISRNPGRVSRVKGYCEAVGSIMWLGESFWALTGASHDAVEKAGWLQVRQLDGHVLRVQASDGRFESAEGPSGALQRDLRSLLFPRSAAAERSR